MRSYAQQTHNVLVATNDAKAQSDSYHTQLLAEESQSLIALTHQLREDESITAQLWEALQQKPGSDSEQPIAQSLAIIFILHNDNTKI